MLDQLARHLYLRLGRRYKLVFIATQVPAGLTIAVIAVLLIQSYYHPSFVRTLIMLAIACVTTIIAIGYAMWRGLPYLERVVEWQDDPAPSAELSAAAWDAATNFPMRSFRNNSGVVAGIATLPAVVAFTIVLKLAWADAFVLVAAAILPVAYGTILNYFIAELLMRPVILDIATVLPDDFPFATSGLLIRKRLKILLPVFTGFVGLIVAAVMTGHGGTRTLAESVAAAVGVGILLSVELTVFLSRSVTGPIASLRTGLARVRTGDYSARVPVVTSDELGELSHDFNLMASGLQERERIRDAFGTYLDRDIVPLILSGQYPSEGIEVTVSIMFVDVRAFTAFAETAQPSEVIAALNGLFEVIVPIVTRHGGHVDKFLGDGLLAAFGAPEGYVDHADRAVAAGCEIVQEVNRPNARLRVGVGVNTGAVVAGSIGGAGRLNFSVIGDPVNVAARVEAATRTLGEDLLITAATRDALRNPTAMLSRGQVELKGKAAPVEVFAYRAQAGRSRRNSSPTVQTA